ncbi:hypothetical protein FN846DRAFT_891151 [Sphaerosporella brunnea]|uniref:Uncharacterized protein n=1 Tax=Sphaerosporella brunnea TaxID=1250544 RepID=A0A5J5ETL8_9PEZI|nr:hypothetical protein FN846DRAFT_891151 [Sphaerosporella brunnea]
MAEPSNTSPTMTEPSTTARAVRASYDNAFCPLKDELQMQLIAFFVFTIKTEGTVRTRAARMQHRGAYDSLATRAAYIYGLVFHCIEIASGRIPERVGTWTDEIHHGFADILQWLELVWEWDQRAFQAVQLEEVEDAESSVEEESGL